LRLICHAVVSGSCVDECFGGGQDQSDDAPVHQGLWLVKVCIPLPVRELHWLIASAFCNLYRFSVNLFSCSYRIVCWTEVIFIGLSLCYLYACILYVLSFLYVVSMCTCQSRSLSIINGCVELLNECASTSTMTAFTHAATELPEV